ncbi:MAG: VWA domain-containing protein [Sandaracinaceae bacterium]|nr:VWA domain-containing protein [Sandaracinaceae bacterium]
MMIGAEGGRIDLMNASVTVPPGALGAATTITVTETTMPTPVGYRPFSPLYRFEPEGLTFAVPVTVSIRSRAAGADVPLGTLFWSRAVSEGGGWERRGGIPTGGNVVGETTHFSYGFLADGVDYTEAPDTSCVRTRVLDTRTLAPSGVGLFFAMDDCWGRPITELAGTDVRVFEDDAALSSEASAELFPQRGLQVFVTLAIDVSASTRPIQTQLVAAARRFVETLQDPARGLRDRVQVAILGFAGEASAGFIQPHTLDLDRVLARLDELGTYAPSDASSTNLNGAVTQALGQSASAQAAFRSRNYGGAFTAGYVVLFTDGTDTAGRVTREAANTALLASLDDVVAVGLRGDDYDPAALRLLFARSEDPTGALAPVIDADDPVVLDRDFRYLAARIAGQVRRSYLLGYCSPKRSGRHTVYPGHRAATEPPRVWGTVPEFDATGFTGGCATAMFAPEALCGAAECGGFGCGACDDRVAACDTRATPTVPGLCANHCITRDLCNGEAFTNPQGYEQTCAPSPAAADCGGTCVDTTRDAMHCGGCDRGCVEPRTRCMDGTCVCPRVTPRFLRRRVRGHGDRFLELRQLWNAVHVCGRRLCVGDGHRVHAQRGHRLRGAHGRFRALLGPELGRLARRRDDD